MGASLEPATRFKASMNGFRIFACADVATDIPVDALVVLEGLVVAGALCKKTCEISAVPLRVADLVRYRLRSGTAVCAVCAVGAWLSASTTWFPDMLSVLSIGMLSLVSEVRTVLYFVFTPSRRRQNNIDT